jgi:hypothetical protein
VLIMEAHRDEALDLVLEAAEVGASHAEGGSEHGRVEDFEWAKKVRAACDQLLAERRVEDPIPLGSSCAVVLYWRDGLALCLADCSHDENMSDLLAEAGAVARGEQSWPIEWEPEVTAAERVKLFGTWPSETTSDVWIPLDGPTVALPLVDKWIETRDSRGAKQWIKILTVRDVDCKIEYNDRCVGLGFSAGWSVRVTLPSR